MNFQAILYNPTKYDSGVQSGFIVFPHSMEQPAGWGEPYTTGAGAPIEPGTAGGPNPNRVVGISKGAWKRRKSVYHQAVGNIDWRGPWRDVKKQERRFIITVNGPPARHWNPGNFVYDGEPKHREIYMDGKVLSCAPYPVLGAAFCEHTDPITEQKVKTLVAICKNGMVDEVYTRPLPTPIRYDSLTDAVREGMEALADSQYNPNGWVFRSASYVLDQGYAPDTPWFFNEDGTQARTMRRRKIVFTDAAGQDREEDSFIEMLMNYSPVSHNVVFLDIEIGSDYCPVDTGGNQIAVWEQIFRGTEEPWTDVEPGPGGVVHNWEEDWVSYALFMQGDHKVAVDWDDVRGAWVYAWLNYDCHFGVQQFWTLGVDTGGPSPNTGNTQGQKYPPSDFDSFGDHTPWVGLGSNQKIKLNIGYTITDIALSFYLGWGLIGTKSMMLGGGPTEEDPYFYFWDSIDTFIHHVDLRSKLIVGYVRYNNILYDYETTADLTTYSEKMEVGGKNFDIPVNTGDIYNRFTEEVVNLGYIFSMMGWTTVERDAWADADLGVSVAEPEQIEGRTYQGVPMNVNDDASIWEPAWRTFFKGAYWTDLENPYLQRPEVNHYFMHPTYCYREGVFASNEKDHTVLSLIYPDTNNGEEKVHTQLWPDGDLGALVGGDRFHTGGPI